ncbi:MAG: LytTR family DNA-binding domain-containing protein [Bacteroidota bacterium]
MIRTILIDDEEDALVILQRLLADQFPHVQILGVFTDPKMGLRALQHQEVDLLVLDIQMPGMTGFELLEQVPEQAFRTIFVTAHDQFAIKAIKFAALDYLLKPIDVDDLAEALSRFEAQQPTPFAYQGLLHNMKHQLGAKGRLALPSSEGLDFIDVDQIIYCEAEGSYTRIHLVDQAPILVSRNLKELEQILAPDQFCRVHHAFLIHLRKVEKYVKGEGGYVIMSNGQSVDISRRKKEKFMQLITRL